MTEHELIRTRLALAATGDLGAEELSQVEQHVHGCQDCRRELDTWGIYIAGLGKLPQPMPAQDLVDRTQARIRQKLAKNADHRWQGLALGAVSVFSWIVSVAGWLLARFVTHGTLELFHINLVSFGTWLVCTSILAWITAATVAVALGHQQSQKSRRVL